MANCTVIHAIMTTVKVIVHTLEYMEVKETRNVQVKENKSKGNYSFIQSPREYGPVLIAR
jgi:hypothetical protein